MTVVRSDGDDRTRSTVLPAESFGMLDDRVSALRAYDRCRRVLSEGLGVEPSLPVRDLFLELLRQDGADSGVDGAVAAVLAAARELSHDGEALGGRPPGDSALRLLRRAAELTA